MVSCLLEIGERIPRGARCLFAFSPIFPASAGMMPDKHQGVVQKMLSRSSSFGSSLRSFVLKGSILPRHHMVRQDFSQREKARRLSVGWGGRGATAPRSEIRWGAYLAVSTGGCRRG